MVVRVSWVSVFFGSKCLVGVRVSWILGFHEFKVSWDLGYRGCWGFMDFRV